MIKIAIQAKAALMELSKHTDIVANIVDEG